MSGYMSKWLQQVNILCSSTSTATRAALIIFVLSKVKRKAQWASGSANQRFSQLPALTA